MPGGSVLWFRHGLRLHDNPALQYALRNPNIPFYPIFIFDGESAGTKLIGYNRMRYLLESLNDIDNQLKQFGGRLHFFRGKPDVVIRRLWEEVGITQLSFEQDCEPVWIPRDNAVKYTCKDIGVKCSEHVSHTLWNPEKVIKANGGIPPLTYQMFLHTVETIGLPPRPVEDIDFNCVKFGQIPSYFHEEFRMFDKYYFTAVNNGSARPFNFTWNSEIRESRFIILKDKNVICVITFNQKVKSTADEVPKPEEFGVISENEPDELPMIRWSGGETIALQMLNNRLTVEKEAFTKGSYLPTHSNPDLLGPPLSLSPALRYGCLSVRRFYWCIHDLFSQVHGNNLASTPSITGQLIWREYFYTMSVNNPNYGQMWNNPICLNIPWYDADPQVLENWNKGQTGFPFIDAAMRQLRREGWLHHAVRNAVASFLTRGGLWFSWEHGLQMFLKYLLDADWSVCAGNWMWVSSSAFETLLDSSACACPVRLGSRLDPSGEYVRRYIPELRNMPVKYIYEPWKAPIEVQEKANCVIGRNYPSRLIDHEVAVQRNRAAMENLRISLRNTPPHCCPSSEDEIRQFMWLPDEISEITD